MIVELEEYEHDLSEVLEKADPIVSFITDVSQKRREQIQLLGKMKRLNDPMQYLSLFGAFQGLDALLVLLDILFLEEVTLLYVSVLTIL
jgi:hypothetical protein